MSYIALHRSLDAAIMAIFLMHLSALTLWMMGQVFTLAVSAKFESYRVGPVLKMIFKGRFDYNLTHVLLFALIITALCIRPDAELKSAAAAPRPGRRSVPRTEEKTD